MHLTLSRRLVSAGLAMLLAAGAASALTAEDTTPDQPERPSGYIDKPGWATRKFSVAAANPLAVDAGYQALKAGEIGRAHV